MASQLIERRMGLRVVESLYAAVMILALTQGPIYSAWYSSGISTEFVPNPAMPLVHYATFIAVQIPGLMLLGRRLQLRHLAAWGPRLTALFLLWMCLSTVWSVLSRQTLIEAVSLTVTALCGWYLVVSFDIATRLGVIFMAMQAGVFASLFSIVRGWSLSTSESEGYWIGIYLNRNSLAPVAAIGVLSGVFLLPKWKSRNASVQALGRGAIALLLLLNAFVLWRTESMTSPAALLLAAAGVLYWFVVRYVSHASSAQNPLVRYAHILYVASIAIGMWFLFAIQGRLLTAVGETADFNGRLAHWRFSWDGFLENPVIGYGWQAAWRDPEFLNGPGWWSLPNILQVVAPSGSVSFVVDPNRSWSHSGYFDVLLGGGIVAAGALLALLVVIIVSQRDAIVRGENTIWNMAVVWFVIAAASQESFIIGNHFLWLLLASVMWSSGSAEQQHRRTLAG